LNASALGRACPSRYAVVANAGPRSVPRDDDGRAAETIAANATTLIAGGREQRIHGF
jgi:hypothetical protein